MRRRSFLGGAAGLLATAATIPVPALASTRRPKVKIINVAVKHVRVIKELGSIAPRPGSRRPGRSFRVGGDNITVITTDAGLTGYGPGVSAAMLSRARELLIGADPLDVQQMARSLFNPTGGGANVEIALWDLVGKVLDLPLYRLWGGRDGRLMPYASQWSTGTPEERARMAQTVRQRGWRAIKFRAHFPTVKEDVALVEVTRKVMGEDFIIMCDANQAGEAPDGWNPGPVRWDYSRALATAREYARLGVYWLEEPLPRWDFDQLAQLSRDGGVRLAGGEGSKGLHEYRSMLERGSLDIIQFETGLVGPTIAKQITTLAAAYDKPCVAHVGFGLGTFCAGHFNASLPNAVFLGPTYGTGPTWEVFHEPPIVDTDLIWSIYEDPPHIDKDGYMQLPDGPGLGVTIKKDLIEDV